jgi:hypothetical protein
MTILSDKEQIEAKNALKNWFISQDINPAEAGIIISMLLAECFVEKTTNLIELMKGINLFSQLLAIDIVNELKRLGLFKDDIELFQTAMRYLKNYDYTGNDGKEWK